jgi:dienelactone hydrolase
MSRADRRGPGPPHACRAEAWLRFAAAAALAAAAGCRIPAKGGPGSSPERLPADVAARYTAHRGTSFRTETSPASTSRFSVVDVTFQLEDGGAVLDEPGSFEWYLPARARHAPVVLVSPILKGDYAIERLLARILARAGISSVVFHQRRDILDPEVDPFELASLLRHHILHARAAIDWLEGQAPAVDARRVGALGVSLGGIKTATLLAVEPRIAAGALVMPGGDLAGIFRDSVEREVRRYVAIRAEREGKTEEELLAEVRAAFADDPMVLARHVDSSRLLVILSRFDRSVPYRYGRRLLDRLPDARAIVYPAGHYSLALFLPLASRELVRFFRETL